jgi:hypothetical protein
MSTLNIVTTYFFSQIILRQTPNNLLMFFPGKYTLKLKNFSHSSLQASTNHQFQHSAYQLKYYFPSLYGLFQSSMTPLKLLNAEYLEVM